jgi:hypothetical protein
MSDERRLCSRCGIFPRKQGEEICEPCMDELILGQPNRNNAWNRFVEEFSDALIRADCRRKQERSAHHD